MKAHPPQPQEQECFPFFLFIISFTTIATKITPITPAIIIVGHIKAPPFTSFIFYEYYQSKKSGISLYIEKDGVYVDVSVAVLYGYNVPELAYRIQQTIKQSVENMTHYKVAEVDVHVLDVVFSDNALVEKEHEEQEEEEENS